MKLNNNWIVVQGVDGSGKTTVVNYLKERLSSNYETVSSMKDNLFEVNLQSVKQSDKVVTLKACGTGPLSSKLRSVYVEDDFNFDDNASILNKVNVKNSISSFMHLEHYREAEVNLSKGNTVISDRWLGCYYAYNYHLIRNRCSGFHSNKTVGLSINLLNSILLNDKLFPIRPDVVIQLVTKPEIVKKRLSQRGDNNKLDDLTENEVSIINEAYLDFINTYQDRLGSSKIIVLINNHDKVEDLLNKVDEVLGL